jgi:hypothetical protein
MGYNTISSVESRLTFQMNVSRLFSGSENKPSKTLRISVLFEWTRCLDFLRGAWRIEGGGGDLVSWVNKRHAQAGM